MKNKTSLQLMEYLVMILVFALSAAICLLIFFKAEAISNTSAQLDGAVVLAQNTAEFLKASSGDMESARAFALPPYRLEFVEQAASHPTLQEVQIQVYIKNDLMFSLNTGWQEAVVP